jgi:hypothetical protein
VEEAAAAADSMQQQAQVLAQTVSVFKVAGGSVAALPGAASRGMDDVADVKEKTRSERIERRGPNRAKNVARIPRPTKPAPLEPAPAADSKTGTDDWSEF